MKIIDSRKGPFGDAHKYVRIDNTYIGTEYACSPHGFRGHLTEPVTVRVEELKNVLRYTGERNAELYNDTIGSNPRAVLRIVGPNGPMNLPVYTDCGPMSLAVDSVTDAWSTVTGAYGLMTALKTVYPFILQDDDVTRWVARALFHGGYVYATNGKNMAKVPCTLPESVPPFTVDHVSAKRMLSVTGDAEIQHQGTVVYVRIGDAVFRVPQTTETPELERTIDVLEKFAAPEPWRTEHACSVNTTADSILIPAQRTHVLVSKKELDRRGTVLTFKDEGCFVDGEHIPHGVVQIEQPELTLVADSTNLFAALKEWGPETVTVTVTGRPGRDQNRFTDGFVRIDVCGTVYVVSSWIMERADKTVHYWKAPEAA